MSLFNLKESWEINFNEAADCFTDKSLQVRYIDKKKDGESRIVVGGHSGVLRVLGTYPCTTKEWDEETMPSVDKEDAVGVLVEQDIGLPILQIELGRFVSGSSQLHLGVLHPQKLAVYVLSKLPGQVEHGAQFKLTLFYEHSLKRHAFNMCVGSFGNSLNESEQKGARDFICVQSLDGTLSFFEQEVFTFSRYLSDFFLPGPISYVQQWDSFVTVTSWTLHCYKYAEIALSSGNEVGKSDDQQQDTAVGRKLNPDWSFHLGEEVIGSIQVLPGENAESVQIILSTFNQIFCFSAGAELLWCKTLDVQINCLYSFLNPEREVITICASGTEPYLCYVYLKTTLKWVTKLTFSCVAIAKLDSPRMPGYIIALGATGRILKGYLGTTPSLFMAPPIQSRDIDYKAAEVELQELRQTIAKSSNNAKMPVETKSSPVELRLEVEGQKVKYLEETGAEVISLIATVKVTTRVKVSDLRVTVDILEPLRCDPQSVLIGDILGKHNYSVEIYAESDATPSEMICGLIAFYQDGSKLPCFISKPDIKIPLFIVAHASDKNEKEADSKLTFACNKPILNLVSTYNDFDWGPDATANSITFRLLDNNIVSLLASTKHNASDISRYRIQSNSLSAIYLVFRDFLHRMGRKYCRDDESLDVKLIGVNGDSGNQVQFMDEFYQEIDAHFLRRQRDLQIKEDISGRAAQFRAIQKRLLLRFKDKNPTSISDLELLLDGTLEQIGDSIDFMEVNKNEKIKCETRLSGSVRLILEVMRLDRKLSEQDMATLKCALTPYLWHHADDAGWEESVYSNLNFLKSKSVVVMNFSSLNISKLKRVIDTSLEKWKKQLDPGSAHAAKTDENTSLEEDDMKLLGNEIVERMTSARSRQRQSIMPELDPLHEAISEAEPLNQENGNDDDTERDNYDNPKTLVTTIAETHPSQQKEDMESP